MLHHRQRRIHALPSSPPRAQAEIRVLAIQEEMFVEVSNLLDHRPPVQRRRPARQQHLFFHRKILRRFPVPTLLAAAVARQKHAGRIQPVFAVKPHLRRAHPRVRPVVERANQRLQPPWVRHRVVVQRGQIPRARCQQPLVDRRPEPHVAAVFDDADLRRRRLAPRHVLEPHQAAPAVIHHDHVKVAPRLFRERFQAFQQSSIGSQRGDNYGRDQFRQRTILPAPRLLVGHALACPHASRACRTTPKHNTHR